jgi:putative membrane protein
MSKSILSASLVTCFALGLACQRQERAPVRTEEPRAVPTTTATPREAEKATAAHDLDAAKVLATLHQDNQNEIDIGKLAQQRGASKHTQEFGAMLVRDHTTADRKIMAYVKENNVVLESGDAMKLTEEKAKEGRELMAKLRGLRGAELDKEFAAAMKEGHEKAIALVKDADDDVKDAKLKALLIELRPTLEMHLEHAKMIEEGKTAAADEPAKKTRAGRKAR